MRKKLVVPVAAILLIVVLGGSVAFAQTGPSEPADALPTWESPTGPGRVKILPFDADYTNRARGNFSVVAITLLGLALVRVLISAIEPKWASWEELYYMASDNAQLATSRADQAYDEVLELQRLLDEAYAENDRLRGWDPLPDEEAESVPTYPVLVPYDDTAISMEA